MAARSFAALLLLHAAAAVYLAEFEQSDVDCAACLAVSDELTRVLRKERAHHQNINLQTHQDRVSSRAPDKKRVVSYKTSELRVIEILEAVCPSMKDYSHFSTASTSVLKDERGSGGAKAVPYFQRLNNAEGDTSITISGNGLGDINSVVGRTVRDQLRKHCDALVESHEDAITEIVRAGEAEELADSLCVRAASQCSAGQIERVPGEARLAGLAKPGEEAEADVKIRVPPPRRRKKRKRKAKAKDEV